MPIKEQINFIAHVDLSAVTLKRNKHRLEKNDITRSVKEGSRSEASGATTWGKL